MIKYILFIALGIFFLLHFCILAFHHLPDNPIKHQLKYEIQAYVEPYFSQQWNLFAPSPIASNMSVNYKIEAYKNGGIVDTTKWLETSEPLIELRRNHSFSAGQRLLKYLSASCIDVLTTRGKLIEHVTKIDSIASDSIQMTQYINQVYSLSYGHLCLKEYGKYVAKGYYKSKYLSYDSLVACYKILDAEFPRFSQRKLDYFDLENYKYSEFASKPFRIK